MNSRRDSSVQDGLARLEQPQVEMLSPLAERELLEQLAACKTRLADALAGIEGIEIPPGGDDPQALAQFIASSYGSDGPGDVRLGAIHRKYVELRGRLAMANIRLVAHVAKRFRDRGIPHSDLMQEGFCGLLEAIDRFNLSHETKLATYATWWIRQSMQQAVAAGAYPVRLSPRHLRQLAQSQEKRERSAPGSHLDKDGANSASETELMRRIQTATRPTLSLDATISSQSSFNLLKTVVDSHSDDRMDELDSNEVLSKLFETLPAREQQVLSLRFGLGGQSRLSLSQVGKVLEVSKERIRQIQDRALNRLRAMAEEGNLAESLALNS